MNGFSLSPLLTGTAIGQSTGTLSAKPETMFGNTLPFRLQLEASTAPLSAAGTIPALQGEEHFVVPLSADEAIDPLGPEATGMPEREDSQSAEDRREAEDTPLAAILPIIIMPDHFVTALSMPIQMMQKPAAEIAAAASPVPSAPQATPPGYALQIPEGADSDRAINALDPSRATDTDPSRATDADPKLAAPRSSREGNDASSTRHEDPASRSIRPSTTPARALPATDQMVDIKPDAVVAPIAIQRRSTNVRPELSLDSLRESEVEPTMRRQPVEALAPSPVNASIKPQTGPIVVADLVAPPTQHFAQVMAAQTQASPVSEPTQPSLPSSANIPFDQNFGQRVGAAIGAAMNAMSVKNGMLLLQITPEHLGKIEIEIDSRMERLQITTENESVRGAIAQAHGRIEHELRQAGQRIVTIDVETRDAAGSHLNNGGMDQRGGQNTGQHPVPGRQDVRTRPHEQGGSLPGDPDVPRSSSNVLYA